MILQLIIIIAAFVFLYFILKPPVEVHGYDSLISESGVRLQVKQDGDVARHININLYEEGSRLRSER